MILLTLRAYGLLLRFEWAVVRGDFAKLYQRVRSEPTRQRQPSSVACARACDAVDRACVLYFRQVQCLQRSAATVCLLRQLGLAARLVIGAQLLPFRAHAWVEIQGIIVNDKVSVTESYAVLDRC